MVQRVLQASRRKRRKNGMLQYKLVIVIVCIQCVIFLIFKKLESVLTDYEKPIYLDKFRKFVNHESFFGYMVGLVLPKGPLSVLCHGDCWTNNFLFQYNLDGSISEVRVTVINC